MQAKTCCGCDAAGQASAGRATVLVVHVLDSAGRRRGRTASVDSLGPLRSPQENKAETLSVPVVRKSRNTDWYNINHKP